MATTWRQLNFFESDQIKDAENTFIPGPAVFNDSSNGSIVKSSQKYIFIGDQTGTLRAIDSHFRAVASVNAYPGGRIEHVLPCANEYIITIGYEDVMSPILKVWELLTSKDASVLLKHLSSLVIHTDQPFPVTCSTSSHDLGHVAIGFADGKVVLVKGDLIRDRGAKQRTVYEGEEPITGLEFLASDASATLYIFSTSKLLTLTTTNAAGRAITQIPRVMESVGAALNCVVKDETSNEIIVVREDAIYMYGVHGRGPCFAIENQKSSIYVHKGYAVIVQTPRVPTSKTLKVLGRIGIPDAVEEASKVTILEMSHKFIAYTAYFPQGLKTVFTVWDYMHLLTTDGKLFRLEELVMDNKLAILYSKKMFTLALNLVQDSGMDEIHVDAIRVRYADYLYDRGEFGASARQYVLAVNHCDASAVMKRYLEAQHIPLLMDFLEALHEARRSNADYTTLLLNCYAKLQEKEKLTKFIKNEGEHPMDLEIAVALCRQAGYYDQAIELTKKHNNHVICLGIMIEDLKDHVAALSYIKRLKDPGDAGIMLNRFGRELMAHLPNETTQLFIDFYTGSFSPESDLPINGAATLPEKVTTGYGSAFYDSMINSRYTQVLPSLPSLDMSQFNPIKRVTSIATSTIEPELTTTAQMTNGDNMTGPPATYVVPSPRTAFPIFADYPLSFVLFLEAMLERQSDSTIDNVRRDLVSTLLEIYLRQAGRASQEDKRKWENKTKDLIKAESEFIETSNAMLLFHLSSFEEGSFMMQERAGRKEDVFRSYCSAKDTSGVLKILRQHGEDEPQLYILALKYFISSAEIVEEAGPELGAVLAKIHEKRLLAPLQVIHALSSNAVATVGVVKEYLDGIIERERREINNNESLINSYRDEADAKKKEATELAENARVLQVSRCARCAGTLDLPVVHFLCKHSFHQRCLATTSNSVECLICQDSNEALRSIVKNKADMAEKQEFFKESLANSRDKTNFLFSRLDLNLEQLME